MGILNTADDLATSGLRLAGRAANRVVTGISGKTRFASLDEALAATTQARFNQLPDELYVYTSRSVASKILEAGRIGRSDTEIVYLTTRGDMPPLRAQLELALPPHNTAEVVFPVLKQWLEPSRVLLIRRVTGNFYNRPGGGIEVLYRGIIKLPL